MFFHVYHHTAAAAAAAAELLSHAYDSREAFSIMKSPLMRQEIVAPVNRLRFLFCIHLFVEHVKKAIKGFLGWRFVRWRRLTGLQVC